MNNKKVNYKTLSKKLGISVATISRYFNNGYISEEKRNILDNEIKKIGYVRNTNAASTRGNKNLTIVVRNFKPVPELNYIVDGIIGHSVNEVIIKYFKDDDDSLKNSVIWAIGHKPSKIIVFAPKTMNSYLDSEFYKFSNNCELIFFNWKSNYFKYVNVSFDKVFKELSQKYANASFIYSNTIPSLHHNSLFDSLKKYFPKFEKLDTRLPVRKENWINIFESIALFQYFQNSKSKKINKHKNIFYTYEYNSFLNKKDKWIFIDYFYIGIRLCDIRSENLIVSATII